MNFLGSRQNQDETDSAKCRDETMSTLPPLRSDSSQSDSLASCSSEDHMRAGELNMPRSTSDLSLSLGDDSTPGPSIRVHAAPTLSLPAVSATRRGNTPNALLLLPLQRTRASSRSSSRDSGGRAPTHQRGRVLRRLPTDSEDDWTVQTPRRGGLDIDELGDASTCSAYSTPSSPTASSVCDTDRQETSFEMTSRISL
eukprot:TRINITY_DN70039_c0_g1_i1.p1 TRINITY_DN70039_c0_g1~~TRINITY_DN70039_c0_g1_i1.p1  ORF type:complete len:198 (+),score=27.67 TRINITY_DN70039_c0_g1_i1:104-697(+)